MLKLKDLKSSGFTYTNRADMHFNYAIYQNSKSRDIYDAYKKPSLDKRTIFFELKNFLENIEGVRNIKVITHNTFHFSIGAMIDLEEGVYYIHITKKHKYIVPIYLNFK